MEAFKVIGDFCYCCSFILINKWIPYNCIEAFSSQAALPEGMMENEPDTPPK